MQNDAYYADVTGEALAAATIQANLPVLLQHVDAVRRGDLDALLANAAEETTLNIAAPPEFPFLV